MTEADGNEAAEDHASNKLYSGESVRHPGCYQNLWDGINVVVDHEPMGVVVLIALWNSARYASLEGGRGARLRQRGRLHVPFGNSSTLDQNFDTAIDRASLDIALKLNVVAVHYR